MEVARKSVEILGRRMNVADDKFKTLQDFTLEETENIHKELVGRHQAEFEIKEAITFLKCRLVDVLNTKETITSLECRLIEAMSTQGRHRNWKIVVVRPRKGGQGRGS